MVKKSVIHCRTPFEIQQVRETRSLDAVGKHFATDEI